MAALISSKPRTGGADAPVISAAAGRVIVGVIKIDEELIIAKGAREVVNSG